MPSENVWFSTNICDVSGTPVTEKSVDPERSTALITTVPAPIVLGGVITPVNVVLTMTSAGRPTASAANEIVPPSVMVVIDVPWFSLMLKGGVVVVWALAAEAVSNARERKWTRDMVIAPSRRG